MIDTNPIASSAFANPVVPESKSASISPNKLSSSADIGEDFDSLKTLRSDRQSLEVLASEVELVVNAVAQDTDLSFSVDEELSRMVVVVRAVGSDEIIRQFPPEEFITVAKHLAKLTPDLMDEDYLKGVLFDQRT